MTAFTANSEIACVPTAVKAAVNQRKVMEKIVDERKKILDLRLDVSDALDELVSVTDWADKDLSAEQKAALEKVVKCRIALSEVEARIDYLQRVLDNSATPDVTQ